MTTVITANPGMVAYFDGHDPRAVEAFDDEGGALVIGDKGTLVRADSVMGFRYLRRDYWQAVGVLPRRDSDNRNVAGHLVVASPCGTLARLRTIL